MDQMDIDHTVEVPDTPDRLTTHGINHKSCYKEENQCSSTPSNSLTHRFLEDGTKDQPMVIDSPNNSAAFSRTAHIFRKGLKEKNPIFLGHDSVHGHTDRPFNISRSSSSSSQDGSFLDRAERNSHKPIFGKRSGLANGVSSLHGPKNFRTSSRDASEEAENLRKVGSRAGFGDGIDIVDNIPRVNKQKRLVRNGCISPNNIAKAKQLSGKDINGSVAFEHNNNGSVASNAPTTSIDIRELVAEDSDSHKRKGKGVISHPCLSKVPDFRNKNLPDRSSMSFSQNAKDTNDRIRGKSIDESGGWRSTRNHTREINISSPDKERYPRQNEKERKEKGISVATGDNYPNDLNLVSSEHLSSQTLMESGSQPKARLGRLKGPRSAADTIKRQKQMGSRSSGECSTSVSDDPQVVFLSSSSQAAANSKSTSTSVNNLQPVIEVDEFSPELRHNNTHDEDARARQLEADERLARELQEQLYNEMPAFGVGEVDEHIALALQQQGSSNHRFSQSRPTGFDARGSFMSNLHRQSQSRSSNVPRRGSVSRATTLGRMTRLRSRFPGQPRTILPSRGRTSLFPADMDVDMRMHILGALEEFSDLGVTPGILQAQRDFNENDYEMLLALDENNDQHGGASVHQINGLPQSTVQSDNFEEACAICLDNPTIGDTIRHLPCLHKYHKDCIDPWLRRRTSCPVCKSSIT